MENVKKINVYNLASCGLMAAILCVLGPLSLPIGPIPISMGTFVVYLITYILDEKFATVSILIYLLLGAVGLPVFSGYAGGVGKLLGPTGGYLAGYILLAVIGALGVRISNANMIVSFVSHIAGTALLYALGTAYFMFQTGRALSESLALCVYPFIPLDLVKIVVAFIIGKPIRKRLLNLNKKPENLEKTN